MNRFSPINPMSGLTDAVRKATGHVTPEEMNRLQEHGLISDNCVTWQDVADSDKGTAANWLVDNPE